MTGARALAPVALLAMTAAGPAVQAVAWADVSAAYADVHDYTCLYQKEERAISNGEPQRIRLSFRKPLDVKLEWLNKDNKVDQIAVYRQGMNDGKVLARRTGGIGSLLGTLKLDPTSGRALDDSRHPITDVGIGHIVDNVSQEIANSGDAAAAAEGMLDGTPAYRFELNARSGAAFLGVEAARHATIWVDRDSKLPVDVEIRDGAGGLIERHRFFEIRINPGLTDQAFTL
ncbi:MAG: DUF1571 domain-containing protein [Vicinamibacterales bacterium]